MLKLGLTIERRCIIELDKKLKDLRTYHGLKQKELAKAINVSSSTISGYENGKNPDYNTLVKLANYFKVSVDYLLDNSPVKLSYDELNSEFQLSKRKYSSLKLIEMIKELDTSDQEAIIYILESFSEKIKYQKEIKIHMK